jgi:ferric-dicitrate binding protein FerR (iron transport regulator)
MRTRGVLLAWLWTALSISVAALSTVRIQPLRHESEALLVRSQAHADAFASSFDGQFADQQLDTFQQRREVVSRVQSWQRLQLLGGLGALGGLFAAWLLWMLGRLHAELVVGEPRPQRGSAPG